MCGGRRAKSREIRFDLAPPKPGWGAPAANLAERGGFEPPVRFNSYNGLANRRIRPLCHLSINYLRPFLEWPLTLADVSPTFANMNKRQTSKAATVKVGNISVKIYRRKRRMANGKSRAVFEVVDYSLGKGNRRLRSFSDESEAREEAERLANQLSAGDSVAAQMTGAEAHSYGLAIQALRPTGIPLELAAHKFAEAFKILGGDKVVEAAQFYARHQPDHEKTVPEVVSELLLVKAQRTKRGRAASERYLDDLRRRLTLFVKDFAANISGITGPEVQAWLDGLKKRKGGEVSPQTAKNFRTTLRTLFAFAEKRGYIAKGKNPIIDTEEITSAGGDVEIFTPIEMAKLLGAADSKFQPVLALCAFAGIRTAEIERLAWEDVDLPRRFIKIHREVAKTASRRLIPIQDNLASWLAPYAGMTGPVWNGNSDGLVNGQRLTARKAGVEWKHNALRHSYASYRIAQIGDAGRVAAECGNSPAVVERHYKELVTPDRAQAWFAIAPEGPTNIVSMSTTAATL